MPPKGSRKSERAKYIPAEEVSLLLTAPREAGALRDHYFLSTLFYCGLRIGECVILRPEHFDLAHDCMQIPTLKKRTKDAQGNKIKVIPLKEIPVFPEAKPLLQAVKDWAGNREWVFPGQAAGKHLTTRTGENIFARWTAALKLDKAYTPHSLRHTACSMIAEMTKDPILVRDFARHGNVSTTNVYLHRSLKRWNIAKGSLDLEAPR